MDNLNRVHLNGLRAVEAVGRLGGLKAAAGELGVTVGAVSQQIQKVEQQLGVSLFDRHPRGLAPTAIGEAMLERLTPGMRALAAAVALPRKAREDTLTVSVAPVFASKWLVWHLKKFSRAHPGIRVRVEAAVDLVDPNSSDVDLCIRVGPGPYADVEAEKLLDQRIFPVCSPALADALRRPEDIFQLPIIHDRGQPHAWDYWLKAKGIRPAQFANGPTYSDGALCLDAAIAGQGLFLAWETLACHALAAGQLVEPFTGRISTGHSYWLLRSAYSAPSPAILAFRNWIHEELPRSLNPAT